MFLKLKLAVLVATTGVAVAACGSGSDNVAETTRTTTSKAAATSTVRPTTETVTAASQPPAVAPQPAVPTLNKPRGYISEATWAGEWPFTVPEGTLMCAAPSRVTFTANRTMYALNGPAKQAKSFEDINDIWKSSGPGLKVNLGPAIDEGLTLCN